MTTLSKWSAVGETFRRRDCLAENDYVQVSIRREVSFVSAGKKRARKSSEPVLNNAVMALDAWETLSRVLQIAGCEVTTRPRSW